MPHVSTAIALTATLLFGTVSVAAPVHDDAKTTTTISKTTHKVKKHTTQAKDGPATAEAADNTRVNKRDRDDNEPTADQQSNATSDVELAAELRRAISDDKALSVNAHNVKIIVRDGNVLLKGPVDSVSEKAAVERLATKKITKGKVTSELAVTR
jgi:hyperosmotically inducible protein